MKKNIVVACCLLIVSFFACENDDNSTIPDEGTTPPEVVNFEDNFGNPITARFIGSVIDEDSNPVQGAIIRIGNAVTSTDIFGIFSVENADAFEKFAYIRVDKAGYISGSRALVPSETEVNRVEIMLLEEEVIATINSGEDATVNLPNGTNVTFDGNFTKANGNPHTGAVQVMLKHLSPDDENMNAMMPGMLFAEATSGDAVSLETYGMLAVELRSETGEELQLAEGSTSQISMLIASSTVNPPATIPLWYFDEDAGYWKEEGQATLQGNAYVGDVTHFTFWNYDFQYPPINLCITLVDDSGNSLPYTGIQLSSSSFNNIGNGFTNSSGVECGLVPADIEYSVLVQVAGCPNNPFTTTIGPFNADGNVTLTIPSINTTTITGTFLNCDGNNVTNGYVQLIMNDVTEIIPVTDGSINHIVGYCENTNYTLKGIDFGSSQTTGFITGTLDGSATIDLGTISACVAFSDTDGDSIIDELEDLNQDGDFDNDDTDGDGTPDYLDIDDDNDSINTINEDIDGTAGPTNDDSDSDGIPNYLDADDDNDSINTINEDVDGDTDATNDDTDSDGLPNYLDSDDDNDSVATINEDIDQDGDATNDDTDNDGTANYLDTDDDNDSLETSNEDVDQDGNVTNDDTDQDGIPNYLDADDDNDGINTIDEDYDGDNNPTNEDSDGDGTPDYLDEQDVIVFSGDVQSDTCTDPQGFDLNTISTNLGDTLHTYAYYATQADAIAETNPLPTSYSVPIADLANGHIIYVKATNIISGQTTIDAITLLLNSQNTDGDGLTDCEELTGVDDPSTSLVPNGTSDPNDPNDPIPAPVSIYMTVPNPISDAIGQVPITFTLGSVSNVDTTINVGTSDGFAISGADYTSISTTITIPAGQLSEIVNIPITNDLDNQREDFRVSGIVTSGNTSISNVSGRVYINPDTVVYRMYDSFGYENDGVIEVKVVSNVPAYTDTTVNFSINNTTASTSDYSLSTNTLIIPAGEFVGTLLVNLNNDNIEENTESFELTSVITNGVTNQTIVTDVHIYDDDITGYRDYAYIVGCDFQGAATGIFDLTRLDSHFLNGNLGSITYFITLNDGNNTMVDINSPQTFNFDSAGPSALITLSARIQSPTGAITIAEIGKDVGPQIVINYSSNPTVAICDSTDGNISNGLVTLNLVNIYTVFYNYFDVGFYGMEFTYYENLSDAESGVNAIPLPENYTTISSMQTIYIRIEEPLSSCAEIQSITVIPDTGC